MSADIGRQPIPLPAYGKAFHSPGVGARCPPQSVSAAAGWRGQQGPRETLAIPVETTPRAWAWSTHRHRDSLGRTLECRESRRHRSFRPHCLGYRRFHLLVLSFRDRTSNPFGGVGLVRYFPEINLLSRLSNGDRPPVVVAGLWWCHSARPSHPAARPWISRCALNLLAPWDSSANRRRAPRHQPPTSSCPSQVPCDPPAQPRQVCWARAGAS